MRSSSTSDELQNLQLFLYISTECNWNFHQRPPGTNGPSSDRWQPVANHTVETLQRHLQNGTNVYTQRSNRSTEKHMNSQGVVKCEARAHWISPKENSAPIRGKKKRPNSKSNDERKQHVFISLKLKCQDFPRLEVSLQWTVTSNTEVHTHQCGRLTTRDRKGWPLLQRVENKTIVQLDKAQGDDCTVCVCSNTLPQVFSCLHLCSVGTESNNSTRAQRMSQTDQGFRIQSSLLWMRVIIVRFWPFVSFQPSQETFHSIRNTISGKLPLAPG